MDSQKKKVLIIAYAFPPHSVVGSMRPLRIAKYLQQYSDWISIIITINKKFKRAEYSLSKEIPKGIIVYRTHTVEPLELLERNRNSIIREIEASDKDNGSNLNVDPNKSKGNSNSFFKKAKLIVKDLLSTPDPQIFWILFAIIKGLQVIKKNKVEMIFVTAPPWSALISGFILSKLTKIPWIADFRDPWTDIKRGEKTRARERFELLLEKRLLMDANGIISTSNTYTNNFRNKYRFMERGKFFTLHNGFDENKFINVEAKTLDRFTVVHLGSLYSKKEPYCFFEAFSDWIKFDLGWRKNVELMFVGEIDQRTRSVIEDFGLMDVTKVTGFVNHERAIQICMSSDLLLLAMGTGPLTARGWLPAKIFEYIACNKPILANVAEGEAADLIRSTKSGYVVSKENVEDIIPILNDLYKKKFAGHEATSWGNDISQVNIFKQINLMRHLGSILDEVAEKKITKR